MLSIHCFSDKGSTRETNEDSISYDADLGLAVLADGMGGHNAGEVASQLAVSGVMRGVTAFIANCLTPPTLEDARGCLKKLIPELNDSLHRQSNEDEACRGMGCTLVVVWVIGDHALIASIGDSRCYLWRSRSLTQITSDHNFLEMQRRLGLLSDGDIGPEQPKNYLTRALGIEKRATVDYFVIDLAPEDVFMSCTDGLTECLNKEALEAILNDCNGADDAAEVLGRAAIQAGSQDNVSVQVLRVGRAECDVEPAVPEEDRLGWIARFWQNLQHR